MTQIDIAALVADREAGTKGPWVVHEEPEEQIDICAADRPVGRFVPIMSRSMGYNDNVDDESRANARRIARVPDMEAALSALTPDPDRLLALTAAAEAQAEARGMRKAAEVMTPKINEWDGKGVGVILDRLQRQMFTLADATEATAKGGV